MKIKNNGKYIISVGVETIMPGDEATIPDSMAKIPAIKAMEAKGIITIVVPPEPEDKPSPTLREDAVKAELEPEAETEQVEADAETPVDVAEDTAEPKKRGRPRKAKE